MAELIWVDGWQMQCCGQPFAVGTHVEWRLNDAPDVDWLETALDPVIARRISYSEEHHDDPPGDHPLRQGTVVAIQGAFCRYAPTSLDERTLYPVAGSAVLREVSRADGDVRDESGERFNGYVVEVELLPSRA
ncbi:DUF6578 domain-containing protein [Pengzhenrongella phosphoraccumulans]|uniref:DUF6578 domain-containing protein n=1 Tax=Pengzhenrongella phosphoraccumulans TaxID=3114394 RepID=UPI00388D5203